MFNFTPEKGVFFFFFFSEKGVLKKVSSVDALGLSQGSLAWCGRPFSGGLLRGGDVGAEI